MCQMAARQQEDIAQRRSRKMRLEEAKSEIISVFSEAGEGIGLWIQHLQRDEIESLLNAAAVVKDSRQRALCREQGKIKGN